MNDLTTFRAVEEAFEKSEIVVLDGMMVLERGPPTRRPSDFDL